MFCGPKTAVVARGEAEGNNGSQGAIKSLSKYKVFCYIVCTVSVKV